MTVDPRDVADHIADLFPYDGPYSPERTAEAAAAISALVRYLNNATGKPSAIQWSSDVARVTGNLAAATYGMRQLLTQLADLIDRFGADPGLHDGHGDDPAATVWAAASALHEALDPLAQVATDLQRAQAAADRLGIRN